MCSVNISIHFLKLIFKAVWIEKKRLWKRYLKNLRHNVNSCSLALTLFIDLNQEDSLQFFTLRCVPTVLK